MRLTLALTTAVLLSLQGASAARAQTTGPLRVHPENPRYFTDDSGKAILLAGSPAARAAEPLAPIRKAAERGILFKNSTALEQATGLDTVVGKMIRRLPVHGGAVQQRLGWNATRIQTGATRHRLALRVQPVIDTGGLQTKLRAADGGHVTRRSGPDHNDIEFLVHDSLSLRPYGPRHYTSSSSRAGSSSDALTATRNCTASLPSMSR